MTLSSPPNGTRLPRRPYGTQGVMLSVIGFGGIVVMKMAQREADRVVAEAVARGVNYFDVAPTYGDAEQRLGPALEPWRDRCFLACKTTQRTADGVREELAGSCRRLRTDHVDLYQLHALTTREDVDRVFGKGGAMEAFIEAKQEGRARHLGFSAHSVEAAVLAMERYPFDSVLFPVNFATWQVDFGPAVLAKAREKGVSVLALKTLARQQWPSKDDPGRKEYPNCWYQPVTDPAEQALAVRFTLGQPITAALPPGEESLFWRAVEIAEDFAPLSKTEQAKLDTLAKRMQPIFGAS